MHHKSDLLVIPALWLFSTALWPQNSNAFRPDTTPFQKTPENKTEPDVQITPEMRGDIFMARKMYREAAEMYMTGPHDSPVIWNKTGIAYHQQMLLDQARKHYEKAIKLHPTYSEAINNLGTVFYAKKNYKRAIAEYKRALKLAPNSASIHSNLGTGYFARKQYKDAADEYQIALNLDPDVFEHRSTQGILLQERSVLERAKFHYYLAKTYAKAGANERALLYMRKCLEEGFKDKKKFTDESEFASLQDLPEFKQILAMEPRVL
jgi:tetratricopeptide (TPR) repeat protein